MAFTKPNDPAAGVNPATYAPQAAPDKVDWDIIVAGSSGTGVVSGCAVTAHGGGAMAVDVASGVITVAAGAQVTVSAASNLTVTAADLTNPRIDLVVVNSSGVVSVTAGAAAATPCMPNVPASSVALAEVYVPATQASVIAGMLRDLRVAPSASYVPQTGSGSPVGSVTPAAAGASYTDTATGNEWVATSTTTTSWRLVSSFLYPATAKLDLGGVTDMVTATSTTVTSATAAWKNGQTIVIRGGNSGGATYVGTITAGGGTTSVTVSPATTASASGLTGWYGTDDTVAWQTALNAAPSGATVHAGPVYGTLIATRVDTSTWTSGSSTISDTSITAADLGKQVQCVNAAQSLGIPVNSFVGTVTPGTSYVLVNRAGTPVTATANGTGAALAIGGLNVPPGVMLVPTGIGPWEFKINPVRNLAGPTFGLVENTTAPAILLNRASKIGDPILYSLNQLNNTASASPTQFQPMIQGALANSASNQANGDSYGCFIGKPYITNAWIGIAVFGGRWHVDHPYIGALRFGLVLDYCHDFTVIGAITAGPLWSLAEGTWTGSPVAGTFDAQALATSGGGVAVRVLRADSFYIGALNAFLYSTGLVAIDSADTLGTQSPTCGYGVVDKIDVDTCVNGISATAVTANTVVIVNAALLGANGTGVGGAGNAGLITVTGGSSPAKVVIKSWATRGTFASGKSVTGVGCTNVVPGTDPG